MSRTEMNTSTTTNPRKRKLRAEHEQDLHDIDTVIKRVRRCVPEGPYVLTVEQTGPAFLHCSKQEAYSWRLGTPFDWSEETLQYQSFVYRENPGVLVQRSAYDIERERRAKEHRMANGASSSEGTPLHSSVAKKKISLNDYKNKKAGKPKAKESNHVKSFNGRGPQPNGTAKHESSSNSGSDSERNQPKPKSSSRDFVNEVLPDEIIQAISSDLPDQLPAKKVRGTDKIPSAAIETTTGRGLPPLMSPLGAVEHSHDLPPMLSPTLPANIEAQLKRHEQKKEEQKKQDMDRHAAASDASTPSPALNSVRLVRHSGEKKPETKSPPLKALSKFTPRVSADDLIDEPELDRQIPKSRAPPQRPALLVRLKYGKQRRKLVERILRLRPSSAALRHKQDAPIKGKAGRGNDSPSVNRQTATNNRATAQNLKDKSDVVATSPAPTKRPRPEEDHQDVPNPKRPKELDLDKRPKELDLDKRPKELDLDKRPKELDLDKRPKELDLDKRPSTPNKPDLLSPTIQQRSGSQKPHHAQITPFKAAVMSRSSSLDGTTSTPRSFHPTPPASTSHAPRPTSAPNGGSSINTQALTDLSQKLTDLGRKLRLEHIATVENTEKDPRTATEERKRGALKGLESVLCFVMAFAASDAERKLRGRGGKLEPWRSLRSFYRGVATLTKEFPHLEGLRAYLGVAIATRIGECLAAEAYEAKRHAEQQQQAIQPQQPISRAPSEQASQHNLAGAPEHNHESPESMLSGGGGNNNVSSSSAGGVAAAAGTSAFGGSNPPPVAVGTQLALPLLLHEVSRNWTELTYLSNEASLRLNALDLERHFPKTWAKRAKTVSSTDWAQRMLAIALDKERERHFWLPLGVQSSVDQFGSFAVSVLKEAAKGKGCAGYEVEVDI